MLGDRVDVSRCELYRHLNVEQEGRRPTVLVLDHRGGYTQAHGSGSEKAASVHALFGTRSIRLAECRDAVESHPLLSLHKTEKKSCI